MLALFALTAISLFVGLAWLVFPIAVIYLGHRILGAVEQRPAMHNDLNAISLRLLKIEERVEQIAADTERVSDGLRFTNALVGSTRARIIS
jgi:hypothetical protein